MSNVNREAETLKNYIKKEISTMTEIKNAFDGLPVDRVISRKESVYFKIC